MNIELFGYKLVKKMKIKTNIYETFNFMKF